MSNQNVDRKIVFYFNSNIFSRLLFLSFLRVI